jgi:hypothetical protein
LGLVASTRTDVRDYSSTFAGSLPFTQLCASLAASSGPAVLFTQAYNAAGNRLSLAAEIDSTDHFRAQLGCADQPRGTATVEGPHSVQCAGLEDPDRMPY